MSFDITKFKSTIDKYGGPAKNNLFVVGIFLGSKPGSGRKTEYISQNDIRFFCREVNVPSLNIGTFSYQANSIGVPQNMPINLTTPSINTTFMLDSEHRVISFFHSWMQEIINYNKKGGLLSAINGDHMPYEIGYKDDYTCVMEIDHYKTDGTGAINEIYKYTFDGVYPTEVGGRVLSWAPDDTAALVTVNFTASSFSFTASTPGQLNNTLSRGNGALEFLNTVGFRGQTVQQNNLPTSIQDAINTFTTVRNDFAAVRNTFTALKNIF